MGQVYQEVRERYTRSNPQGILDQFSSTFWAILSAFLLQKRKSRRHADNILAKSRISDAHNCNLFNNCIKPQKFSGLNLENCDLYPLETTTTIQTLYMASLYNSVLQQWLLQGTCARRARKVKSAILLPKSLRDLDKAYKCYVLDSLVSLTWSRPD